QRGVQPQPFYFQSFGYIDTLKQKHRLSKVCSIIQGGAERQDSVWNGLKELAPMNVDLVLIHDAVRPFITQNLIHSVLLAALEYDAAIAALSPRDTVKHSREQNFIEGTYDRKLVWLAQTPQAFRFSLIYDAFEKAFSGNYYSTDDASLVERLGKKVRIVEGFSENIKITTPDDLELAELIVKRFVLNNT
ncbi:MAG: 2-C-methyl-D-erythritol 4-phosphate cytidylyltransferase, partial [Ignavibacteriales bacterium]|nr:2-C-methyl-D-erythritol 4-phosphate cytidylyltransferase [Ignavibacteriales bacterium]